MIDIYKLVNVPTSLNYLKTKVDDSDIGKLKTIPVEFKKFSDVVDNEVVKNTKFKLLKTKVNKLNKKIPDVTTLIHINQYHTDKQNLEKKIGYSDKKIRDVSELVTTTVFNTKVKEGDNKIPDLSGLVKKTDYDAKTLGHEPPPPSKTPPPLFCQALTNSKLYKPF